ncbi:MAG: Protein of unknown function (DUF2851) [Bacteroidetes bacterium HLUCCA01]|nr:MAG: Protein of unknown function (DUF2851) [Bacteroidetes bacterium HLUCCA01]
MRELIFQRLWQHHAFDETGLTTTCGRHVELIKHGELNTFDGPDFFDARIMLDGLSLFGCIELHIHCNDWYLHGHQHDSRYNNIVLHVVLQPDDAAPVQLENGSQAPTVVLKSHLHSSWQTELFALNQRDELTCSGFLRHISPDVIREQLEHAARLYFTIKREKLFAWYDAHRKPSDAFLRMLWIGCCDGLGIPANRQAMVQLAEQSWDYLAPEYPLDYHQASDLLFMLARGNTGWNKKAGRPVSRPENRIRQAAHLLVFLQTHGMGWFLGQTLTACVAEFGCKPFAAGQRGRVLIHTVLLPALHILGSLVHKTELTTQAEACWINGRVPVPSRIERVFRKAGGAMQLLHNHPGTLPLYRYQCSQGGCASCRIFKSLSRG